MATINPVPVQVLGNNDKGDKDVNGWQVTWSNIGNADTPAPTSQFSGYAGKSFQVEGTFGGATVQCQGSNDGTNFHQLNDPSMTAIGLTAGGIREVLEHTLYFQPALSGGSGSSITVTMYFTKTRPL